MKLHLQYLYEFELSERGLVLPKPTRRSKTPSPGGVTGQSNSPTPMTSNAIAKARAPSPALQQFQQRAAATAVDAVDGGAEPLATSTAPKLRVVAPHVPGNNNW